MHPTFRVNIILILAVNYGIRVEAADLCNCAAPTSTCANSCKTAEVYSARQFKGAYHSLTKQFSITSSLRKNVHFGYLKYRNRNLNSCCSLIRAGCRVVLTYKSQLLREGAGLIWFTGWEFPPACSKAFP